MRAYTTDRIEKIKTMRAAGHSYNEIVAEVGCNKSTVSYHCGPGQKEKTRARTRKHRSHPVKKKLETFKGRRITKSMENRIDHFQRERGGTRQRQPTFQWTDVIDKFGMQTFCYLTGRPLDLNEPRTYSFDHIIPVSRGGSNDLSNLGITCREVNLSKTGMTVEEFEQLCMEVLVHRGYRVESPTAKALARGIEPRSTEGNNLPAVAMTPRLG